MYIFQLLQRCASSCSPFLEFLFAHAGQTIRDALYGSSHQGVNLFVKIPCDVWLCSTNSLK
jgi:hypothetical protein